MIRLTRLFILAIMLGNNAVTYGASQQNDTLGAAKVTPQKQRVHALLASRLQREESVPIIVGLTTAIAPNVNRQQRLLAIQARQSALLGALPSNSFRNPKRFRNIPFLAITVNGAALNRLLADGNVVSIEEDRLARPSLADSTVLVGADSAWAQGYGGLDQVIAVLDTGIQTNHDFLAGKIVREACFSTTLGAAATTLCPDGSDTSIGPGSSASCTGLSDCRHGTHVAGIAAGFGSFNDYGVARDAQLISIQVFSRFQDAAICGSNGTNCLRTYTSDYLQGLEYTYDLRNTFNIAAANLSIAGDIHTSTCDNSSPALTSMIDLLRSAGIATVIASGNSGSQSALAYPACVSSSISVGATHKNDSIAAYSNSAPFLDLLGPGSSIRSSVPVDSYAYMSGTSMATPHVAGAWAILRAAKPSANVAYIESLLKYTALPITDTRNGLVRGRIDIDAAIREILKTPAMEFGRVNRAVDHNWHAIAFSQSFIKPVFIAGVESYIGSDTVGLRSDSLRPDGVRVLIEEERSLDRETGHAKETVGYAVFERGLVVNASGTPIGEAGELVQSQSGHSQWHRVTLTSDYGDTAPPIVIMQPLTRNGGQPAHVRLRDVSGDRFFYQIEEWDYLDQTHAKEVIPFVVVKPGIHELPGGHTLEAGFAQSNHAWSRVRFQGSFASAPVTISQPQSYKGGQAIVTRQTDVSTTSFSVRLQEEEGNDGAHARETVGYIALGR